MVAGAVALVLVLAACELLTNAGQSAGIIPKSKAIVEAAKAVDTALGGWVWGLLFGGPPVAVAAGVAVKRAVRKRRAKREAAEDPVARMRENGGA